MDAGSQRTYHNSGLCGTIIRWACLCTLCVKKDETVDIKSSNYTAINFCSNKSKKLWFNVKLLKSCCMLMIGRIFDTCFDCQLQQGRFVEIWTIQQPCKLIMLAPIRKLGVVYIQHNLCCWDISKFNVDQFTRRSQSGKGFVMRYFEPQNDQCVKLLGIMLREFSRWRGWIIN